MTFSTLLKTCSFLLFILLAGCSGDTTTSDYNRETTFKSEKQVVAGLVYGHTGKTLSAVSGEKASANQLSIESGQYAIANYPAEPAVKEDIFSASFTDGSLLYSVWSGVPTPSADITVTFDEEGLFDPSNVNVSPDNFDARANINPITDLAYRYWLYDGKQSSYYYYLASVFLFFKGRYFIPEQNAVHDYPSPEILRMFAEIQVKISVDATGFSLISNATGQTICTATFAQFPICN